jgi:hypothetical protein
MWLWRTWDVAVAHMDVAVAHMDVAVTHIRPSL